MVYTRYCPGMRKEKVMGDVVDLRAGLGAPADVS